MEYSIELAQSSRRNLFRRNFEFKPEALSNVESLSPVVQKRIIKKITWLAQNIEQISPQPLSANLKGFYKIRIGDYRVIYDFSTEAKIITIYQIGHRREIYR